MLIQDRFERTIVVFTQHKASGAENVRLCFAARLADGVCLAVLGFVALFKWRAARITGENIWFLCEQRIVLQLRTEKLQSRVHFSSATEHDPTNPHRKYEKAF